MRQQNRKHHQDCHRTDVNQNLRESRELRVQLQKQ